MNGSGDTDFYCMDRYLALQDVAVRGCPHLSARQPSSRRLELSPTLLCHEGQLQPMKHTLKLGL